MTTNLCPITVSSGFVDFTGIEPFSNLVVHVLRDVLVVAIQAGNPLVVRGNGNAASSTSRESIRQHSHCCRHTPNSDIAAVFVFRQADAELSCLENDISGLVLVGQLIAQILESLEVFLAVCFIGHNNAAAIVGGQVIFRHFKSVGGFRCALNILPIRILAGSSFITELPLAVIVEMCGVSALSVRSIDFNGAVFGIGSGDGVAIQNEVGSVVCNLDIAGISTDFIECIDYSVVHLAALPDIVGTLFKDGVLCGIFDNEVVPGRLVLFVVVESQRRINSKVLLALPLIGDGYIVTIQQSIQSDRIANIRSQFIAVFRRYCLQTDESGFCSFRSRDFCVVGIRFRSLFPIHHIRRCILSSFIVRVGILIRIMRQVHNIRDSRRGSGIRGVGII